MYPENYDQMTVILPCLQPQWRWSLLWVPLRAGSRHSAHQTNQRKFLRLYIFETLNFAIPCRKPNALLNSIYNWNLNTGTCWSRARFSESDARPTEKLT